MNVELLETIKARILAEPDAFRMDQWTCGTAHCIAGWALKLSGVDLTNPGGFPWEQLTVGGEEPSAAAAKVLDLSTEEDAEWDTQPSEAGRLFHVSSWPSAFEDRYCDAEERAARAQIAAERIDHFIATGGAE